MNNRNFFLIPTFLLILSSCGSVRKSSQSRTVTHDSTAAKIQDTSSVKKTTVEYNNDSSRKTTRTFVIEFPASGPQFIDTACPAQTSTENPAGKPRPGKQARKANKDFFTRLMKIPSLLLDTGIVRGWPVPSKITLQEVSETTWHQDGRLNLTDSNTGHKSENAAVHDTEQEKTVKGKKTGRGSIAAFLLILGVGLFFLLYVARKKKRELLNKL